MLKNFRSWIRRLGNRRVVLALATVPVALAVVVLFAAFGAAPAAAQGTTPPCSTLVSGTRFSLPAMMAKQEAAIPTEPTSTALCVEGLEDAEGVALKLNGVIPFTASGNDTPLTVSAAYTTTMALPDGSYNGSILNAAPSLPTIKIVTLTDVSEGVTIWVGTQKAAISTAVVVDQWADVTIPGSLGELRTGTTKWSGNGVTILVTSGAAYSANGTAILPQPGKVGEYEFYVDGTVELELEATVNGQRFYLAVDADNVTTDSWLQRRVEAKVSPAIAAVSTAGAQYVNLGGACFSAATCSASQAVACVAGAPKLPCTPGDTLSVWRPMRANPRTHPVRGPSSS